MFQDKKEIEKILSALGEQLDAINAAVDQGMGKHYNDLLLLEPNAKELDEAARWSMTHDVSETFRQSVKELLKHVGFEDVAKRL